MSELIGSNVVVYEPEWRELQKRVSELKRENARLRDALDRLRCELAALTANVALPEEVKS